MKYLTDVPAFLRNVVVDEKRGYVYLHIGKHGIVLGTPEEIYNDTPQELGERVVQAVIINDYNHLGTAGVYVVH